MSVVGTGCRRLVRALTVLAVWSGLVALTGCATPQVSQLQATPPPGVARTARLTHVPFVAQEDYACGPASLHMAMAAAGREVPLQTLMDAAYLPERKGTLQVEMLAAVRRQGLVAYPLEPSLQAVLREIDAGHPVVVFLNLSLPVYPVWHYAVAVGYDLDRNVMVLHSGPQAFSEMSLNAFERTWERSGNWAMVVLPASTIPATAQPLAFLKALSALEPLHPEAARAGYARATQRWPHERNFWLGLGNAAVATNDAQGALQAYLDAVQRFPDFADAWNNLAQWYQQAGQLQPAKDAIARALALGGPRKPQYQALSDSLNRN